MMPENNEESILNVKLILYFFESMSINCHKSDVYVIGVNRTRKLKIAAQFNCKLGDFPPLIYLRIPIHINTLRKQDLRMVNDKMSKRIDLCLLGGD
jgi:hypothetical protein